MPKTTLRIVNVAIDPTSATREYYEADITLFTEQIYAVTPFFDAEKRQIRTDMCNVFLITSLVPIIVKSTISVIEALMENQPYSPVSDGSGGSTSGGTSSGSGFSGQGTGGSTSVAFKGSLSTTFNGACQATTAATYYHNGAVGNLPAAGNQVFTNSNKTTAMADGYYGIAVTGTTATHSMRVVGGYVASGWPIACGDLEEIPEP